MWGYIPGIYTVSVIKSPYLSLCHYRTLVITVALLTVLIPGGISPPLGIFLLEGYSWTFALPSAWNPLGFILLWFCYQQVNLDFLWVEIYFVFIFERYFCRNRVFRLAVIFFRHVKKDVILLSSFMLVLRSQKSVLLFFS